MPPASAPAVFRGLFSALTAAFLPAFRRLRRRLCRPPKPVKTRPVKQGSMKHAR